MSYFVFYYLVKTELFFLILFVGPAAQERYIALPSAITICIAVGKVSLELCPYSRGHLDELVLDEIPPSIIARFAMLHLIHVCLGS